MGYIDVLFLSRLCAKEIMKCAEIIEFCSLLKNFKKGILKMDENRIIQRVNTFNKEEVIIHIRVQKGVIENYQIHIAENGDDLLQTFANKIKHHSLILKVLEMALATF